MEYYFLSTGVFYSAGQKWAKLGEGGKPAILAQVLVVLRLGGVRSGLIKSAKRPFYFFQSSALPTELPSHLLAEERRYYAWLKRGDKQFRRSLKTKDRKRLAYSGCRVQEGPAIRWCDVDSDRGALTVTGGEIGTKNHEHRTIPMTDALRSLLTRLRDERNPQPTDTIAEIKDAKKCLATACRRLGYPHFTHHDLRHFFATTCIEAGVDIPTVSRWLGHKDGGALAMRVYGHLRQEHRFAAVKKVQF